MFTPLITQTLFLPDLVEVYPDPDLFSEALVIQERMQISFYDVLMVAAAERGEVKILYSEDLQHEREYRGLRIVNPFV